MENEANAAIEKALKEYIFPHLFLVKICNVCVGSKKQMISRATKHLPGLKSDWVSGCF